MSGARTAVSLRGTVAAESVPVSRELSWTAENTINAMMARTGTPHRNAVEEETDGARTEFVAVDDPPIAEPQL